MLLAVFLTIAYTVVVFALTRKVVPPIITAIVTYWWFYLLLPVQSWDFLGTFMTLLVPGVMLLVVFVIRSESFDSKSKTTPPFAGGMGILGTLVLILVIAGVNSCSMIHSQEKRELIGEIATSSYSEDTSPIDLSRVRIVDESVAVRLGDKRLGEDPGLGSRTKLGRVFLQEVNGKPYYVAPLLHSGFFKWLKSPEGTPGYVKVSATNQEDVELVTNLDGEPMRMRYNTGAYFSDDPRRHLYRNGYSQVGLTDFTFGINDQGRPYYVVTMYDHKVGFGGSDATGVLLLDVQTGEIHEYGLGEVPPWVDRIQPMDFVVRQLRQNGKFVNGWWNSFTAMLDVVIPSEGATIVYGTDGTCYLYTGMTSAGADEGTVGFVLVDLRTKKVRMYEQPGATESAARASAMGAVQEKEYSSSWPILYNVSSRPTYYMTLKDNAGLIKLHAFVSVENYQIVGTGETIRSAHRAYRSALIGSGDSVAPDGQVELVKLEGEIVRIAVEPTQKSAQYYFLLDGVSDHTFVIGSESGAEVLFSRVGDRIRLLVEEGEDEVSQVVYFDNLDLDFRISPESQAAMERARELDIRQRNE